MPSDFVHSNGEIHLSRKPGGGLGSGARLPANSCGCDGLRGRNFVQSDRHILNEYNMDSSHFNRRRIYSRCVGELHSSVVLFAVTRFGGPPFTFRAT